MGIMDKAKEMLGEHKDKADTGIDKAGDLADKATGNKYGDKVDQAQQKAKDTYKSMSSQDPTSRVPEEVPEPTQQVPQVPQPPAQ